MLKPDIKEVTDFDVDEKFSSYLDFIDYVFCPRGWYESIDDKKNWHHSGGFSFLLNKGKKISQEEFLSWKNDIEHGFFHGFLVGFWIFCQSRNDLIKHLEKDKQRQKKTNHKLIRMMTPTLDIIFAKINDEIDKFQLFNYSRTLFLTNAEMSLFLDFFIIPFIRSMIILNKIYVKH